MCELGEIEFRQQAAQGDHARLAAERFQVGAHETVRDGGQVRQINVAGQRHSAAVNFQNLPAAVLVGNGDGDFPVEPPGPAQGGVEHVGQVGGRQHDHVLPLRQAVHQGQQLGHHALSTSPTTRSRRGAMASISSRKMMLGARAAASSKTLRRWASLSP